jgi:hypothetical protein
MLQAVTRKWNGDKLISKSEASGPLDLCGHALHDETDDASPAGCISLVVLLAGHGSFGNQTESFHSQIGDFVL